VKRETVFAWRPVQVYEFDGRYLQPVRRAWLRRLIRMTTAWGDTVHVEAVKVRDGWDGFCEQTGRI
jgi:hypothetical protein